MWNLLKSWQWSLVPMGAPTKAREPWTLDRNWHRAEAERHLKRRDYPQAERHLALAVADADRRNAPMKVRVRLRLELADARRRTVNLNDPATAAQAQRILVSAESVAREAIHIAADASAAEEYVDCLDALADIFWDQKSWPAIEKIEEDAIRLGAQLDRPDPIRMAKRVHRLAIARHQNGHGEHSIPALEKSLQLHEQSYGPNSPKYGELLSEAGTIYRAEGEHLKAQECFRRAMQIHSADAGFESQESTQSLHQLASSLEDSGDVDGAAALYENCLVMKLRKIGVQHIEDVAITQYSLANLHVGWGNLARARELLTDCIGVFKRDGGIRLAVAHETLAQIEERSGRYHSALKELENAGKVWELLPGRTTELLRNMAYRADLFDQLRKTGDAEWLRSRMAALELGIDADATSSQPSEPQTVPAQDSVA